MWVEKGHLVVGAFVNGGNLIFSEGNFINIRGNQSKTVSKLKNFGGKCVSGIWKYFLIGGIFFPIGGKCH